MSAGCPQMCYMCVCVCVVATAACVLVWRSLPTWGRCCWAAQALQRVQAGCSPPRSCVWMHTPQVATHPHSYLRNKEQKCAAIASFSQDCCRAALSILRPAGLKRQPLPSLPKTSVPANASHCRHSSTPANASYCRHCPIHLHPQTPAPLGTHSSGVLQGRHPGAGLLQHARLRPPARPRARRAQPLLPGRQLSQHGRAPGGGGAVLQAVQGLRGVMVAGQRVREAGCMPGTTRMEQCCAQG